MLIRFADVDGVSTRYLCAGPDDAPVLLLVHGLTLTCDIWTPIVDRLARDRRVVAPDMLGHGFTRPRAPAAEVDIAAKAAHLFRFVQATTQARRFDVAGASYGALVACNMALRDPASIRRLVLHGSASCFGDEVQLRNSVERAHRSYADLLSASSPDGWSQHLAASVFDARSIPPEVPHVLGIVYAQSWIRDYWSSTIECMSDPERFRPFRVLERLDRIGPRTLVVWGLDDRGAPITSARQAIERMPDATLVPVERCGHFPMFERPATVANVMHEFLVA